MKFKFQVMGAGETSFTSPKSGRVYNRLRLIGMVVDPYDNSTQPAVADLAFDAPAPSVALTSLQGGTYLIDCVSMDSKSAMLSFTFKAVEVYKSSKA